MTRTGIVLAQLGGPERLEDVEPFIRSIFADPLLVPLPGGLRTRAAISAMVARVRAPRARSHYSAIGGGSPIIATTQRQADALSAELINRGHDVQVVVAHRYSRPDTTAAVDSLLAAGVDRVVLMPLFPQYSAATTGSSEAELRRVLHDRAPDIALHVIRSWCDHPSYLDAQAHLVDEMMADLPDDHAQRALLVFSAHGLPQRLVDRGDPYLEQVDATVAGVTSRLRRPIDHVIAFQSRAGPVKWIDPDVRDVVADAPAGGRTWLGVVPISFVSEHVETLHELDIQLRDHARAAGITEFHRCRCLDVDPVVGPVLADVVEEHL
ncbi:MAG TPA: ferrochelatase [Ilumatobacteraceae bacterium]|nr:ferrochelatase [Ilumatobacteraceae bacterium]